MISVLATVSGLAGVSLVSLFSSDSTASELGKIRSMLEVANAPVVEVGDRAGAVVSVETATKLAERDTFTSGLKTVGERDVVYVLVGLTAGGVSNTTSLVLGLDEASFEFRRGSIEVLSLNSNWKWIPAANDGLVDGGADLGSFRPGASYYLRFAVHAPSTARCGIEVRSLRLFVRADGWAQTGGVDIPAAVEKRC